MARLRAALILATTALLVPSPAPGPTYPSTIEQDGRAGRTLRPATQYAAVEARPLVSARAGKSRNARARAAVPTVLSVVLLVLVPILLGAVQVFVSSIGSVRRERTWLSRAPPAHIQPA